MNNTVKFICSVHVNFDSEVVIFTPNIFIHDWGTNPTVMFHIDSIITQRAYDPITVERGIVLRCNHEYLRLRRVDKNHFARIRQDIREDVINNACSPANHAWVMPRPPCPMILTPTAAGLTLTIPTDVLRT